MYITSKEGAYNTINLKKTIITAISLLGMTLGSVGVASANAAQGAEYNNQPQEATVEPMAYTGTSNNTQSSSDNAVVQEALQLAGMNIPYVWGGESLSGMDCSGLTEYVYQKVTGKVLGHNTVVQEGKVTKEAVADAQPGDLLFWGAQGSSYHVAIYIGDGKYVAAPQPGQNVEVESLSSGFAPSFAGHVN